MAEVFLNSAATGAGDGTSEADAYTDIRTALGGLTFGDTLWVKNSGATYEIVISSGTRIELSGLDIANSPEYNQSIQIKGYYGSTGDNPTGANRPVITRTPNNVPQITINFPIGLVMENLIYDFENNTTTTVYQDFSFRDSSTLKNCKFVVRDPGVSINPNGYSFSIPQHSHVFGCEFDYQVTTSNAASRSTPFIADPSHSFIKGCVFRSAADSPPIVRGDPSYPSGDFTENIFIGNGNTILYHLDIDNQGGQFKSAYATKFRNCIFYNGSSAIKITPPNTVNTAADTESEWAAAVRDIYVLNCIFENCTKGVEVEPYIEPTGWLTGTFRMDHVTFVKNCYFYNMTTANVDGDLTEDVNINLTVSPFVDAANNDFAINEVAGGGKVIREQSGYEIPVFGGASVMKLFSGSVLEKDFSTTDTGSFSLGTGGVGDTVTVSGKSFQLVQDNPRAWRRV